MSLLILLRKGHHKQSWLSSCLRRLKFESIVFQNDIPDWMVQMVLKTGEETFYRSCNEWSDVLREVEHSFGNERWRIPKGLCLTSENLKLAAIQQLDSDYKTAFTFAKMCLNVFSKERSPRFVFAAPRPLCLLFEEHGIPVSHSLSNILWQLERIRMLKTSIFVSIKELLRIFVEPFQENHRNYDSVFLGIQPHELSTNSEEIDAFSYVDSKQIPPFSQARRVLIPLGQPSYEARYTHSEDQEITLARPRWGSICFTITGLSWAWTRTFLLMQLLYCSLAMYFRNRWHEFILANHLAVLPRMDQWWQSNRPRSLVLSFCLYNDFPLWARLWANYGTELWMTFYSTLAYPLSTKNEPIYRTYLPVLRYSQCDRFALWDSEQKEFLLDLGLPSEKLEICQPMVFGKPIASYKRQGTFGSKPVIAVFDIAPTNAKTLMEDFGVGFSYYSFRNMSQFLEQILSACRQTYGPGEFVLALKPKRKDFGGTTSDYANFIDEFLLQNSEARSFSSKTNPGLILAEAHAVISAPFTSPSRLASAFNLPACFFDPTGDLLDHPLRAKDIPLFSNINQLRDWLIAIAPNLDP